TRPLSVSKKCTRGQGVEVPLSDTPRGKRLVLSRELSIGSSSLLTSVTVDKENTSVQPQPASPPPSTPISPDQRPIQSLCHAGNAPLDKREGSELKATDFRLAVTFPSSSRSNFEVWDQENELFFVGPLSLHLILKDPAKLGEAHPRVSDIEIKCTTVDSVKRRSCIAPAPENYYSVQYTGAKMRNAGKKVDLDPTSGIVVDTVWLRTSTAGGGKTNCGWGIKFFVPIATGLFDRRETRMFQVEGRLSVKGEQLGPEIATISVSHLLWEREMVR
ncbi:hypothetical protein B0H14DRAFT_2692318, partial [Mycena olivaceomarginata]